MLAAWPTLPSQVHVPISSSAGVNGFGGADAQQKVERHATPGRDVGTRGRSPPEFCFRRGTECSKSADSRSQARLGRGLDAHGALSQPVQSKDRDARPRPFAIRADFGGARHDSGRLGQCGLIARARLRLMPAPAEVVRRELIYQDLDAYLADASRLTVDSPFHYQRTAVTHAPDGGWSLEVMVGMRSDAKQQNWAPLPDGLKFQTATEQTRVSYEDYTETRPAMTSSSRPIPRIRRNEGP